MKDKRALWAGFSMYALVQLLVNICFQLGQQVEAYTFDLFHLIVNLFALATVSWASIMIYRFLKGRDDE